MIRRLLAVLCAATVGVALVPAPEAAEARKGRKVCVIKKRGMKPKRRLCRARPARRPLTPARRAVPVPTPALAPIAPLSPGLAAPVAAEQPPPGSAPAAPPAATPAAPACSPSPWLGVTAEDAGGFRLVVSRTCVPAGRVLVQLRNIDSQPHNVYAEGVDPAGAPRAVVDDVDGGVTADGAVDLAPGRWRLYCAVRGHEAMSATITATR